MISSCWHPELEQMRLCPWSHVLGFRGHYSTRSRCYSTTLTALRQARRGWRDERLLAALGYSDVARVDRDSGEDDQGDEETVMVIGYWQYIGRGHSPREATFARTTVNDLAENRRICHQLSDSVDLIRGWP